VHISRKNCAKITTDILLHVVRWFPRWQHRCCRASRAFCSNYLLYIYDSSLQMSTAAK